MYRFLAYKEALFGHLQQRWKDLFNARFEVLLYDLTSACFESDPPEVATGKRRFGYSRDSRSGAKTDCRQAARRAGEARQRAGLRAGDHIALVVSPEGFPLAYEVLAGNTADNTALRAFLDRIEKLYGRAERIWLMDRGIPTEEVLAEMRQSDPAVFYLAGAPKGRLSKLEKDLASRPRGTGA